MPTRVTAQKKKPAASEVTVANPAYEVHQLRMQGVPWREATELLGYASETAAKMAVPAYLARAATEIDTDQKREALQTQLDRYEAVLRAWWKQGTTPVDVVVGTQVVQVMDDRAAATVLKTLAQIDKLYNFGADESGMKAAEIIVIGGTPEQYTAGLKALAEAETQRG